MTVDGRAYEISTVGVSLAAACALEGLPAPSRAASAIARDGELAEGLAICEATALSLLDGDWSSAEWIDHAGHSP